MNTHGQKRQEMKKKLVQEVFGSATQCTGNIKVKEFRVNEVLFRTH